MKFNKITQFVLGTGITLALAASVTFPFNSSAADQLKGAQLLVGQRLVQTQALPPVAALSLGTPACPACTNSVTPFTTSAGRGAFVKTGVIVTHQCPFCKTAIVTAGAGKAKTETPVHTCGNGTAPSCCGGTAGM